MGKHTQSTAERERIRQDAEKRRKDKENKVFYTLVIITVIIVAAFFIINHFVKESAYPELIRDTSTIQDNWIVIDVDNKVTKRYHHPASFDIPEGYVPGDFSKYRDGVARDFYLEASDPEATVSIIYVDAAPELTGEEYISRTFTMYQSTLNEGSTVQAGLPFTATIAGETAHCLYLRYSTTEGDYGCLLVGFDAPDNVCVTASLSGKYVTDGNVQTQEELLAEAGVLLDGLTIIH